jgi:hypothetical protein
MTKDEALDLALETLMLEHGSIYDKAITAIKQARSAPVQEPVAIDANMRNVLHGALKRSGKVIPPPAQPAPVQEPSIRFNTAEAMDKAKADRDKPVTPVEYIPVISEVGSDSNMVFPDTMYGLLPKGTGKIMLHESKPAQQEPVALTDDEIWKFWWNKPEVPEGEDDSMEAQFVSACREAIKAATQRQSARSAWAGLTDEEKRQIFVREGYQGWLDYINAIEAKLKEKNT